MDRPAILIDPGHGGEDPGTCCDYKGTQLTESSLVLSFARLLSQELQAKDYLVYLTRQQDTENVQLSQRVYASRVVRPAVFLSLHINAGPSSAHGFEVFYSPSNPQGQNFAQELFTAVEGSGLINVRGGGPKSESSSQHKTLFVLKNNPRPAALVELGFLSNEQDREKLLDKEFQDAMIEALCVGISNFT